MVRETADNMDEASYEAGRQAAMRSLLGMAIREMGDGPERNLAAAKLELAEARAMLRQVCEDHGDNDWPDDLHLADVIEKHLWRHLDSARSNPIDPPPPAADPDHP